MVICRRVGEGLGRQPREVWDCGGWVCGSGSVVSYLSVGNEGGVLRWAGRGCVSEMGRMEVYVGWERVWVVSIPWSGTLGAGSLGLGLVNFLFSKDFQYPESTVAVSRSPPVRSHHPLKRSR